MDDNDTLLRDYAAHRNERAFAELVARHLPLVYGTARRLLHDAAAAEDVAQTVFIALARKPWMVRPGRLSGWLYAATKHAVYNLHRTETRRRQRETDAMNLADPTNDPAVSWERLAPLVDDALAQLNPVEQNAILLRYFNGQSMSETGRLLALSEPAAQKRVSRALEKMRNHFARQGVTASAALLGAALDTHAATPPPVSLAGKITGQSVSGAAGPTGSAGTFYLFWRILFMSAKTKTALTVAATTVLLVLTFAGIWWYSQSSPAPAKIADLPINYKYAIDPKSPALHPPPTPPIAPPPGPTQSANSDISALASTGDPQADLKTALPDIARLYRTGQYAVFIHTYVLPERLAGPGGEGLSELINNRDPNAPTGLHAPNDPEWKRTLTRLTQKQDEETAQRYESFAAQTPTYNATGDEATYTYMGPTITTIDPITNKPVTAPPSPMSVVMVKINGRWFFKSGTL